MKVAQLQQLFVGNGYECDHLRQFRLAGLLPWFLIYWFREFEEVIAKEGA